MSKTSKKNATMEDVWTVIKASEEARLRGEEALRESYLQTQKEVQKTQKEVRELNESLKEANGNFNKKWGHFLENLLEGDLIKLLSGQNIKVEEVVVVEVKTTLEKDAVGRFLKELTNFKDRVSVYKDKTLYGAMAYMSVKVNDRSKEFREYKNASEMAEENGLFLIQSPGGAKDVSKIVNKEGFSPKVL